MRIGRARVGGSTYLVRVEDDEVVLLHRESDHPAADALREALAAGTDLAVPGVRHPLAAVTLLAPVRNPSKFLGVGLNYRQHALESGMEVPDRPVLFVKLPNAIVGPGDDIIVDASTTSAADFEVELAIVIGVRARNVPVDRARDVILGYTVCNDVTARDAQFSDGQWVRSKSFDSFAPIGPVIVTADEMGSQPLHLETTLNGEVMQSGWTDDMIFDPAQIVSFIASCITLEPGDVIITGTPPGVGFARTPPRLLREGDVVSVAVDGIGSCVNRVQVMG